ncbi:hypothetical protein ASE48_11100 [Mycobacterium sp. Root265]|uniref:hypothetical protein n=1 Tax=Mycobacterium sp. Root265 TaxID=1736504 RepID=UPI00070FEEEE|nr:hypothetical protein [Mycobacterium sp. Root265]KRD07947.1 hypothetical protein ASE48_11100 [Mycobacterium sp. Root265]
MEAFLLSVHVIAGILFIGPVAVSTSLFPRYAPDSGEVAVVLHRITRVYGLLAVTVPVVGLALAFAQGRATEVWVLVAMLLTALAGGLLALQITPRQRAALAAPEGAAGLRRLGIWTGVFNLLWAVVVVLMIVRPGSSYT